MSETTATILIAVLGTFGSALAALLAWLVKKGLAYLDAKTKILDGADQIQRKEALKRRIAEVVQLTVRSTAQTYVDELKEKNADGKLTKDEAREAFKRTYQTALSVLKSEGLEAGREILSTTIEAVVGSLKGPAKNSSGGEATPATPTAPEAVPAT